MAIVIRECTIEDIKTLQEISYNTFCETFSHLNTEENMTAYLDNAFDRKKLKAEIRNPFSTFYFLYFNKELAGYLKINVNEAQTEKMGNEALEIERIYIQQNFQHQGLGKRLFNHGLEIAKAKNKKKIWLGVWEKNLAAIDFYHKLGFNKTGTHSFYMGDEQQTDFIMTKTME